jgi:hypothetical protein
VFERVLKHPSKKKFATNQDAPQQRRLTLEKVPLLLGSCRNLLEGTASVSTDLGLYRRHGTASDSTELGLYRRRPVLAQNLDCIEDMVRPVIAQNLDCIEDMVRPVLAQNLDCIEDTVRSGCKSSQTCGMLVRFDPVIGLVEC